MNNHDISNALLSVNGTCEVVIDIADPNKKSNMAYQHFTIKEVDIDESLIIIYVNESIGKDAWSLYNTSTAPQSQPQMRSSTELESLRLKRMALAIQVSELDNEIRLIEKSTQGQKPAIEVYKSTTKSTPKITPEKKKEAQLLARFKALTPEQQANISKLMG